MSTEEAAIPSLTTRAANATWWSSLEIACRYGTQFILTIILARLLTPADFGLIAMLLVFTSIAVILVDSGFGTALIQRKNVTADDETTVFVFSLVAGLSAGLILWSSAPWIAHFYRQPELVPIAALMALLLPLSGFSVVPNALLTRRLSFAKRASAEFIASVTSAVVAVTLALHGFGPWSIAWQVVVAMALRAALLWYYAQWMPHGRFTTVAFRNLFGFGGFMLLASLLDTAMTRLQALLVGRLFDVNALGYYTLAQNVQQAPASFMSTTLNRVGLPVFSEIAGQPEKLRNALRTSLHISLFIFLPCMVGLALAADPLIVMIYGPQWKAAAPILSLLALAASLWPLHVINLTALTAQGHSGRFFRLEVIKKLASIVLIIGASPYGPVAIAAAVLVSSCLGVMVNTWYTRSLLNYGALAQIRDQRVTIALCIVSALSAWSILHWSAPGTLATLSAIIVAATVYLAGAFLLRSEALEALMGISRNLVRGWLGKQ